MCVCVCVCVSVGVGVCVCTHIFYKKLVYKKVVEILYTEATFLKKWTVVT